MAKDTSTPLFCIKTKEKVSGKDFYINFCSSEDVAYPTVDYDGNRLAKEMAERGIENVEEFKIPLMSSPIFWSKRMDESDEKHYVIKICINDKFAIRRVLANDFMRNYLVEVAMLVIEEKYNSKTSSIKTCGQFIGHKLDLDFKHYTHLSKKVEKEISNELVNNKITLLDNESGKPSKTASDPHDLNLDMFYRPASKLLTVSILTDKCPESISYNDDRIIVKQGETTLCDTYLPFYIDLSEPVKYKFFDKFGAIRMVFKIKESL